MAEYTRFINDEQWKLEKPKLPEPKANPKGKRPPIDNRQALEGILWILRTGARWHKSYRVDTLWRRLRLWEDQGVWLHVGRKFLSLLDANGMLDWEEAFIDGIFAPAKRGRLRRINKKRQRNELDGRAKVDQKNDLNDLFSDKGYNSKPLRKRCKYL